MSQPAAIDGLAFARSAGVFEGRLSLDSLPRLARSGCSDSTLDFVLKGEINERGKPGLRLAVNGSLRLECQRCLGSLDLPLHLEVELEFAASEAEIRAADDDVERILADPELSVRDLVEDEVLLALPMVPKHEQCSPGAAPEADVGSSAFAALAALKKSN